MRLNRFTPHQKRRHGISLVEVMIGIAITSAVLLVMIQFFRAMSDEIAKGRAVIEMASQGRSIGELMRNDLAAATVKPNAWTQNSMPNGYFEVIEGLVNDGTTIPQLPAIDPYNDDNYLGDFDDILGMTSRSKDRPYRGRYRPFNAGGRFADVDTVIESEISEIVWWSRYRETSVTVPNNTRFDHDDQLNVYRRVLLIRPDLNNDPNFQAIVVSAAQIRIFYEYNDISVRWQPIGGGRYRPIANTLAELAVRANRFGRFLTGFPNELTHPMIASMVIPNNTSTASPRPNVLANALGNDLILANVAAFDIRVFSPNAGVFQNVDGQMVKPGDPGYAELVALAPAVLPVSEGAYVDLGYGNGAPGSSLIWFFDNPASTPIPPSSVLGYAWTGTNRVWCSWWPGYESDGIDQDEGGVGTIDQGTDWLDSNGNLQVDDQAERETIPPYAYPIRGIQITLRMVEKNSGQVRQMQIESSFVPE